ncbi:MAG: glycerophosphodiester phosphodiesterase [Gammaproteobacteria bacterium]
MFELPKIKLQRIGHRGLADLAPENTLLGLEAASKRGLGWVEFDVRTTKDSKWVLLHDASLKRTTAQSGWLSKKTWPEIQAQCPSIPSLEAVLKHCKQLGLYPNIEIKTPFVASLTHLRALKQLCCLARKYCQPLPLISSFNLANTVFFAEKKPEFPLALLIHQDKSQALSLLAQYPRAFYSIHINYRLLNSKFLDQLRAYSPRVFLYNAPKNQYAAIIKQYKTPLFVDH